MNGCRYHLYILTNPPPFLLPPSASARKGDAGRVAVVGGCREYTGAPWFAAMAALKVCEGGKRV